MGSGATGTSDPPSPDPDPDPDPNPDPDPAAKRLVTTILKGTLKTSDKQHNIGRPKPTNPRGCDFLDTRMSPVLLVVRAHTTFHTYPYLSQVSPQRHKHKHA